MKEASMGQKEVEIRTEDGVHLRGFDWRPEGDPLAAICLVHGIGEHVGRYAHMVAALNRAGLAVVGVDLRGHGRSDGPRGFVPSYEALLDDLALQLEQAARLYPGKPLFHYGHSLGGNLVLLYALKRRPTLGGVVSSSPQLRLAFQPPAWKTAVGRLMSSLYPPFSMASGLELAALSHDPAVVQAYVDDPLVHDRLSARLGVGLIDTGRWLLEHAGEFSLPLLIFHGSEDRLTLAQASQEFAAKVPADCTCKIWPGLYHETHNEPQKAEVIAFMLDWLKRHLPAKS
jgi:alpha-beta hydrolase superfamily lysophospholipase